MSSLFSFISNPFESWLGYLALLVGSAGISIILFTVVIRLILSPLQITQLRSARAMQRLQPKIQELRKKHGKDRQKLTEETMKLYKEHKVNPAMGCLPMLLQFPVLIGLFWALSGLGQTPHLSILTSAKVWLTKFGGCLPAHAAVGKVVTVTPRCWDLINHSTLWSAPSTTSSRVLAVLSGSEKKKVLPSNTLNWLHVRLSSGQSGWLLDPKFTWLTNSYHASLWGGDKVAHIYDLFHATFLWLSQGLGQPDPLYILPVLAGVTQWIQSRMMMQKSADPQQQSMNMLMNFTPLIIIFFAFRYPSGLSLYWVTSTIIGIVISARITGWGTLPRIDRLVLGGGPVRGGRSGASARPLMRMGGAKPVRPSTVDTNGAFDGQADIVLGSPGGNGAEPPSDVAGPVRARQGQRRVKGGGRGRSRGGRRG